MALENLNGFQLMTTAEAMADNPQAFAAASLARIRAEREAEWREKRRGRFTSSAISPFFTTKLGNSYAKGADTYIRKKIAQRKGAKIPRVTTKEMAWGHRHEVPAMKILIEMTGYDVTDYGDDQEFLLRGDYHGSTPDGLIRSMNYTVEGKAPYMPNVHTQFLEMQKPDDLKKIEHKYWLQTQHQCWVAETDATLFFSYHPDFDDPRDRIAWMLIPRDEPFIKQMEGRLEEAVARLEEITANIEAAKLKRWGEPVPA